MSNIIDMHNQCPPEGEVNVGQSELELMLGEMKLHLTDQLLPFWESTFDEECGGFYTHVDKFGNRMTEESKGHGKKSFLSQVRVLYALSAAHLAGHGDGKFAELAEKAVDFIEQHYWDDEHGGWYTMCDCSGKNVVADQKTVYPHLLAIYALSHYARALPYDSRGKELAIKTYEVLMVNAGDRLYGGLIELFNRDWTPVSSEEMGDRKSFDIHMHLMEALTELYEVTKSSVHRRDLEASIHLVFNHMLRSENFTGIAQFTLDWRAVAQRFPGERWGMDRHWERDLLNTSFGHNIEFVHLLRRAVEVLGNPPELMRMLEVASSAILTHTARFGVDWDLRGLFLEGPGDSTFGPSEEGFKEFWQQAEALLGFLDALCHDSDQRWWAAAENIWGFVRDKFINPKAGEWWPFLTREGECPGDEWRYMASDCKVSYHTVRAMLECTARLETLCRRFES